MGKTVLILTGSPRKGGNSDLLADALAQGATSVGHSVTKIETASLDIKGCRACDACYSKGEACVFNDDFNKIAPQMLKADVIVFAVPLYWYTFTTQLKAAIDKMYAFVIGDKGNKIKESILLCCGEDNADDMFDGILQTYRAIAKNRTWTEKGILTVPGVNKAGEILQTNALAKAEELGKAL